MPSNLIPRLALVLLSGAFLVNNSFAANVEKVKQELMEADRAFAVEAEKRGVEGFASYFAETDVLKFQGPGERVLTTRNEILSEMLKAQGSRPFLLRWSPIKADAAKSGELGYTFGGWTINGKDRDGNPRIMKGYYVSIWKKQNGKWKVVADLGS